MIMGLAYQTHQGQKEQQICRFGECDLQDRVTKSSQNPRQGVASGAAWGRCGI